MSVTFGGSAVGFTDGDLEVAFVEDLVDVTAHQEGTNVLSAIRTGKSVELTINFKEVNKTNLDYIYGKSGSNVTASGASASITGWGSGKDFTQVLSQAAKLVLHPVTSGATDYTKDIAFWKAYPVPGSLTLSGENPAMFSATFRCFPDTSKDEPVRLGVIGDHVNGNFASVT
jgi:hypothetical protein